MPTAIHERATGELALSGKPGRPAMYPHQLPTLISVDPHRPGQEQANIHTRWHPDIPAVATLELGKPFNVECHDYSGGQVKNDDCADDIAGMDHDSDHHLSGPIWVPGAEPGDVLEIDILDLRPFETQPWGYCITAHQLGSLDADLGGGQTATAKSIWDFYGTETSSRHVPHVCFTGRPHPGVLGTAPSHALLDEWNARETCLAHEIGDELLSLPKPRGAYVGQALDDELRERIYAEGARTGPPRENGGNIDIGSATRGSKVYLPVYVPGAKLSVGDLHFCEGDGEPTTAIEMAGILTLRVNLIRNGVRDIGVRAPIYQTSPLEPQYPNKLVFTGLSILPRGIQTNSSGMAAYRAAAFSAMDYLRKWGYTREQAYMILSAAPIETKVVATANRPNFVISLGLPVDIFDFDILPRNLANAPLSIGLPALISDTQRGIVTGESVLNGDDRNANNASWSALERNGNGHGGQVAGNGHTL